MREWMNEPEDERPVIAECCMCHRYIHGADRTHYGDDYYIIEGNPVCEDCTTDYLNQNCRQGG